MFWKEMRQEEFEPAIKATNGLCIIPLGSLERHGEHLPVGSDIFEAEIIVKRVAELEPVVVFPTFDFGDVCGLYDWKGSIILDRELMLKLLENLCDEIYRNGFDKILLLSEHGGNPPFLDYFMKGLWCKKRDYSVFSIFPAGCGPFSFQYIYDQLQANGSGYFKELTPQDEQTVKDYIENNKLGGHADLEESCMMLYARPELVKLERMHEANGKSTGKGSIFGGAGLCGSYIWDLNYPESFAGHYPEGASATLGKLFVELKAQYVADACRVFKQNGDILKKHRDKINSAHFGKNS